MGRPSGALTLGRKQAVAFVVANFFVACADGLVNCLLPCLEGRKVCRLRLKLGKRSHDVALAYELQSKRDHLLLRLLLLRLLLLCCFLLRYLLIRSLLLSVVVFRLLLRV